MLSRIVSAIVRFVLFLLSFIPFTKYFAARKAREAFNARVAALQAKLQRRYPGAVVERLSAQGTVRNSQRSIRRLYAMLWKVNGIGPLSGRQWVRLRKSLQSGVVKGTTSRVARFLRLVNA